jgi:hypothetical protein
MRIDNGGLIGINTTTPQHELHVNGSLLVNETIWWNDINISAYNETAIEYANDTLLNIDGSDKMAANFNMSYYNVTQADCIIFKTGGRICTA